MLRSRLLFAIKPLAQGKGRKLQLYEVMHLRVLELLALPRVVKNGRDSGVIAV